MENKLFFNYHGHTIFSDGKAVFFDYLEEAQKQGFRAIGFSDHAPVPFTSSWNMKVEHLDKYLRQIEEYRKAFAHKLDIYAGLEVDYFAPYCQQILAMARLDKLDYFVGSVHYLGFLEEGRPWCIDTSFEEFDAGFRQIFYGDGKQLYRQYFEALLHMIEEWKPTIIGHLDKIKMYNHIQPYFDEHEQDYRDLVIQVLDLVSKYDLFIELNMRGFYKHPQQLLYPAPWILRQAYQRGIKVIVSSDCHRCEELSAGFTQAVQLLKEIGFRSVWYLYDKCWTEWPLE